MGPRKMAWMFAAFSIAVGLILSDGEERMMAMALELEVADRQRPKGAGVREADSRPFERKASRSLSDPILEQSRLRNSSVLVALTPACFTSIFAESQVDGAGRTGRC
jgi:hypothetical protein